MPKIIYKRFSDCSLYEKMLISYFECPDKIVIINDHPLIRLGLFKEKGIIKHEMIHYRLSKNIPKFIKDNNVLHFLYSLFEEVYILFAAVKKARF